MPSYSPNRPAGSGDAPLAPQPRHHPQYNNSGGTQTLPDFVNRVTQRRMGQQLERPTAPFQGSSTNARFIPRPTGSTYQTTTFQCARCQQQFGARQNLDRHSIGCGAAALSTGYFTPYPVAQTGYSHSASQPHGQSPHWTSGSQSQNKRRPKQDGRRMFDGYLDSETLGTYSSRLAVDDGRRYRLGR